MNTLIELAQQAWAKEQEAVRRAEKEAEEEIKGWAITLMEGLVTSRLANYAPDPSAFPKPRLEAVIDLEDGNFECAFTIDSWWFKATSIDDVRRLYLYGNGEPEIFRLADVGRIMEERGLTF